MPSSALKLYNTLSKSVETFEPLVPGQVKLYVCGPTVYDSAHLGHARCYITWDVLYRYLAFLGHKVTYARNVTDVDDKILNRAEGEGCSANHIANTEYERFITAMSSLNVLSPTIEPKATAFVVQMIQGIEALIAKKHAYVTPSGTVYFRVSSLPNYGKLSRKPLDDLQSGARVETDPEKESPLDFALWRRIDNAKSAGSDYFDSPWGRGLPGWHMECSTMIISMLGEQIDIHAGGSDLIFPHHENEIAQSEAWTGKTPFARTWMHNGFVNVSGEKMSKSLGNFTSVEALRKTYSANAIRYFLLTNHYRMPVDFTDEALGAAQTWADKFKRTVGEVEKALQQQGHNNVWQTIDAVQGVPTFHEMNVDDALRHFVDSMNDDLNTSKALAIINKQLAALNRNIHDGNTESLLHRWQVLQDMLNVLGFAPEASAEQSKLSEALSSTINEIYHRCIPTGNEVSPATQLQALIDQRSQAKQSKDWTLADSIRNDLTEAGIQLLDQKDGTRWELK